MLFFKFIKLNSKKKYPEQFNAPGGVSGVRSQGLRPGSARARFVCGTRNRVPYSVARDCYRGMFFEILRLRLRMTGIAGGWYMFYAPRVLVAGG